MVVGVVVVEVVAVVAVVVEVVVVVVVVVAELQVKVSPASRFVQSLQSHHAAPVPQCPCSEQHFPYWHSAGSPLGRGLSHPHFPSLR